jgi:hypothetical protein
VVSLSWSPGGLKGQGYHFHHAPKKCASGVRWWTLIIALILFQRCRTLGGDKARNWGKSPSFPLLYPPHPALWGSQNHPYSLRDRCCEKWTKEVVTRRGVSACLCPWQGESSINGKGQECRGEQKWHGLGRARLCWEGRGGRLLCHRGTPQGNKWRQASFSPNILGEGSLQEGQTLGRQVSNTFWDRVVSSLLSLFQGCKNMYLVFDLGKSYIFSFKEKGFLKKETFII